MSSIPFESILEKLRTTIKVQKLSKPNSRFGTSDIVQESAIQVWKQAAKDNMSPSQINTAWLKTIAFGHFCKLHRFHLAAKRSTKNEFGQSASVTSESNRPDEAVSKKEQALRLLEAIEKLENIEAQIVIRKFYECKTISEIARELELPRHRAEKHYVAAISKLEDFCPET